jgi:hypothetical protein
MSHARRMLPHQATARDLESFRDSPSGSGSPAVRHRDLGGAVAEVAGPWADQGLQVPAGPLHVALQVGLVALRPHRRLRPQDDQPARRFASQPPDACRVYSVSSSPASSLGSGKGGS